MIEFQDIWKQYDDKWVVQDLTYAMNKGEIFALLGPNGAGKTTAIRMMTGQIRPSKGRILIGGHDIVENAMNAKAITGYIPDRTYLYEKLSGREFLAFIASVYGLERNETFTKIDKYLELMGILDAGDELIEHYSHGMRQRLVFASALVPNPEVLIIDEPFVGLDPYGVQLITGILKDLAGKGVTIFLATHSLHIAQDLCHRAGIIRQGRLVAVLERSKFGGEGGRLERIFMEITS